MFSILVLNSPELFNMEAPFESTEISLCRMSVRFSVSIYSLSSYCLLDFEAFASLMIS